MLDIYGTTNAMTLTLLVRYNDDISLEDAIHTALLTLKEGFEGQMTEKTIEVGVIGTGEGWAAKSEARVHGGDEAGEEQQPQPTFRKLSESEVKDFLSL